MAENGTGRVRALIVDDEELGRRMLRSLLDPDDEVQVVGEAASAAEARRKISEQKPDLVFMDIEMPGGNGIEVLQDLGEFVPYVIFVTAHPEFALPAFEVQASDYLVKPVQRQRFLGSVMRAKKRIAERRVAGLARQIAGAMGTNGSGAAAPRQAAQPPAQKYADQMTIRVRRRMFSLKSATSPGSRARASTAASTPRTASTCCRARWPRSSASSTRGASSASTAPRS
jgi:DNA-binding LytR/AlgR family response regulator